jgi:hypothetical protein
MRVSPRSVAAVTAFVLVGCGGRVDAGSGAGGDNANVDPQGMTGPEQEPPTMRDGSIGYGTIETGPAPAMCSASGSIGCFDGGKDVSLPPQDTPCARYANVAPVVEVFGVDLPPPTPLGGPLVDGTYALTALEYDHALSGAIDGGRYPYGIGLAETLFIRGNEIAFADGADAGTPASQRTYIGSLTPDARLHLSGTCGTASTTFMYSSEVDPGGKTTLLLFGIWPDDGLSFEVRTYVKL